MEIILYPGGACGNLVCTMIDDTDCIFTGNHFEPSRDRVMFRRKVTDTLTSVAKDEYLELMKAKYKSIPSHAYEYHIERNHSYILVAPLTDDEIDWTTRRFYKIHPVFASTPIEQRYSYVKEFVESSVKHTDRIISISDVLSGNLVDILKRYVTTPLNEDLYFKWLKSEINKM